MSDTNKEYEQIRIDRIRASKEKYESKRIVRKVRYTKNEYARIEGISESLNYSSTTAYIKAASLSKSKKIEQLKKPNKDIALVKGELNKIGVNINQLARSLNTQAGNINMTDLEKKIEAAFAHLRIIYDQLEV